MKQNIDVPEKEDEFDLTDVAQFIRGDIAEAVEQGKLPRQYYAVRVARLAQPQIRIFTDGALTVVRDPLYALAKEYVRLVWNTARHSFRPSFYPIIENGRLD